jgi:hypothetical protein
MKKLMLTTALASSLLVSGAIAEIKVSGALEVTFGSGETPATGTKINQGTTIGYENYIGFSGGTKLANGMDVKVSGGFDDSTMADMALTFTQGSTSFYIGTDQNGANLDDGQTIPVVANHIEDGNKGLVVSYDMNKATLHNADVIGLTTKTGVGSFSVAYAPKVSNAGAFNDSNPAATIKSGSGTAVGFNGNLGVTGLGVIASYTVKDTEGTDAKEINMTNIGASYNFGKVTVGAQQSTVDDSVNGSAYTAGGEYEARSIGVVFAATDAISIGYQMAELDISSATTEEEIQSITIGYNLGGATVTAQYTDLENKAGSSGVNGEAFELRIKQAY